MAEGDIIAYNDFKEQLLRGVHNLASNSIKITLHTSETPDIDADVGYSDVSATEYGTGAGYTANDKTLASLSVTQDNANDRALWDADPVTWTGLGPLTPATPDVAILWNDTAASPADALICYVELGSTATNGGDYTITWSTSPNAILSLT